MKLKKNVLFSILVLVCVISFSYFVREENNVEKENLKQVSSSSNMAPAQYEETKSKGKDARTYAEEYLERQELLSGINYHRNGTPLICVIQGGEIDTKNLSEDDLTS